MSLAPGQSRLLHRDAYWSAAIRTTTDSNTHSDGLDRRSVLLGIQDMESERQDLVFAKHSGRVG
jgi:hypothetical protein